MHLAIQIELPRKNLHAVNSVWGGAYRQNPFGLPRRFIGKIGIIKHSPTRAIKIFEWMAEHAGAGKILAQEIAAAASRGANGISTIRLVLSRRCAIFHVRGKHRTNQYLGVERRRDSLWQQ